MKGDREGNKRATTKAARFAALLAAAAGLAQAQPPVEVTFGDLAKFTDLRVSIMTTAQDRASLAEDLRRHIEREAPAHLPPGTRLAVAIRDVDMAGEYPPVTGSLSRDLRVIQDRYPPRIELAFRLTRADGALEREGQRELRDGGFLWQSGSFGANDILRYEKNLIDGWLRREFGRAR
jgi:hypothetical protein